MECNQAHCKPPLDDKDFDKSFNQSTRFILKHNGDGKVNDGGGINEDETDGKTKAFNPKQGANSNAKTYYVHKYSKGIPLAEAVIVAGEPYFIQMEGGLDFDLMDKITIGNIEAKPKDTHSYLCYIGPTL